MQAGRSEVRRGVIEPVHFAAKRHSPSFINLRTYKGILYERWNDGVAKKVHRWM
jgi:hypothetical protein